MKISLLISIISVIPIGLASCSDRNMLHNADGSFTINTIELGKEIKGYAGLVPVNVTIKDSRIQKVEILENIETFDYIVDVEKRMLPKYKNLPLDSISEIDAVSGATYSSRAVKKNVHVAVDYYLEKRGRDGLSSINK